MRWLAAALGLLLAGCLGAAPTPPAAVSGPSMPAWVCPAGENGSLGDVCAGTLDAAPDQLSEPFVAVHPEDPEIIVVGANTLRSSGGASVVGTQAAATPVGVDFFVTRDGGATWSHPTPPTPGVGDGLSVQAGILVDPAHAIDRDGVLHVTFLVQGIIPANRPEVGAGDVNQVFPFNEVAYTSSPDLGGTWSKAVILSQGDGRADRNWFGVSPEGLLVATWQRFSIGSSSVAWSNGKEWTRVDLDQCTQVSAPAFSGSFIRVLCTRYGAGPEDVTIREIDPATGTTRNLASVGLACTFASLVGTGQNWGAVCEQDSRITLVASQDGGITWGPPIDLEQAWATGWQLKAVAGDERGRLHVLAATDTSGIHSVGSFNGTLLTQATWPLGARPDPALAPDDYWGLDVSQPSGAVVATSATQLLVMRVDLDP